MTEIILKVEKRENLGGANPKNLLHSDYLPAVSYGPGRENINIKIKRQDFAKIFAKAGRSQIVNLKTDDQEHQVLIHKIQRDPVDEKVIHVDFYEFQEDRKFSVQVPLVFFGESKAVKESGGLIVTDMDRIKIECLAKDLISEIKVDLSKLEELNDIIYISDLDISDKVEILSSKTQVIVSVKAPKLAKELKEEEEAKEESEEVEGSAEGETKEGEGDSGEEKSKPTEGSAEGDKEKKE
ncbi:50S ribosomal protein L25 [bacterium]|nr:50S ribosomal protein L25 [bacterium]